MAKSLTRRANEPQRTQRRRGDNAGGLPHPQSIPRTVEMPEASCGDEEFFCDALDCMNPFYEPESYFDDGGYYVPEQTDCTFDLEL